MGCNTSKESVQPAADEAKEDVKNGDIPKATEDNSEKVGPQKSAQEKTEDSNESNEENKEEDDKEDDKNREEAATRIQAAFRGHNARKSMKETESSTKQTGTKSNSEPTKEQLQEEFRADDKGLCDAATKIQASFRGHMSRREQAAAIAKTAEDLVENAASEMEKKAQELSELEGIDLTDPDLHKAATKIQASFRGHKVRQEVSGSPATAEETNK